MYIRLEFSRGDKMKYLSHLDMVRTFYRAIRRSEVPICYTSGFNPHAQMVFGLPMQVGVTGDAEYIDIKVEDSERNYDAVMGELISSLNSALPDGIHINAARERKAKDNIMSIITHATYELSVGDKKNDFDNDGNDRNNFNNDNNDNNDNNEYNGNNSNNRKININVRSGDISEALEKAVAAFLLPGPRLIAKSAKARKLRNKRRSNTGGSSAVDGNSGGSVKNFDLAPHVRSLEAHGDKLIMTVSAGSINNIKPDLVLDALNAIQQEGNINYNDKIEFYKKSLHRKALYVERSGALLKPIDNLICDQEDPYNE